MLRRLLLICSLAALAACAAAGAEDVDPSDWGGDTDAADSEDTDGDLEYLGPTYWSIAGELVIAEGQIVVDRSALTATFYDERAHTWQNEDLEGPSCALEVVESVNGPEITDETEALVGWWQLSLEPGVESPCPWPVPIAATVGDTELPQIVLGFGELDARLSTAMAAADLDPSLPLYGLYALHPASGGDRVYVFGAAGTQGQFDGSEGPVDEPPPADGSYILRTLVLLPIPEASRN